MRLIEAKAIADPEEIRYTDKHRRSVFHQVVQKNPSLTNMQDLIDLYLESIYQQDSYDHSPVDIHIFYSTNRNILEFMESKKMLPQHLHN